MLKVHLQAYSLLCFSVAGLVALAVLRLLIARAHLGWIPARFQAAHKSSEDPVVHAGGVSVVAGILVVALVGWLRGAHLAAPSSTTGLLVGMGGMFTVGLLEDYLPSARRFRFLGQALVALAAILSGLRMDSFHVLGFGEIQFGATLGTFVTIFWLVLCTNVIGLVNGIDGLAGGISLMVLGLTYDVAQSSGDAGVALFISGMAGGLVALLWFNFPPARVNLGRNGTYLLGMALGGLSIEVSHKGALQFAFLAPTLAMGLPFLDMVVVLGRRLLRGVPLIRGDRRHIHNRLQDQGLDPIQTLMVLYGVSACFLAGGFVVMWTRGQLVPLVVALLAVLALLFLRQISRDGHGSSVGSIFGESVSIRREIRNAEVLGRWLSLQSGRTSSFDEFWERFCFVVQDLGLTGAELQADGLERYYSSGLPAGDGLSSRHRISGPGGIPIQILIRGDSQKTPVHLFYTLAEISAEALQNGLQRIGGATWQITTSVPRKNESKS